MRTLNSILLPVGVLWLLVMLTALPAVAALEDDIARDFAPLDGYVVMQENDEFIVDLDAGHGIRPGDLFAVLGPAREIVHPVSQKVLGKLESAKGILKVTRMASGYSFARALDGASAIKRGDAIRRYALLPANFWDYSGNGRPLFSNLQQLLPGLKWRDYQITQQQRPPEPKPSEATANALTFVYTGDELVVRDPEFKELRRYPAVVSPTPAPAAPKSPVASAPVPSGLPAAAAAPVVALEFNTVQTITNLTNTSLMADFLFIDQTLWMASTDGSTIETFHLTRELVPVASARPSIQAKVLALKWWVPAATNQPHLAVTTWKDHEVSSLIYRMEGNRLIAVADGISRMLGTFDKDSDGLPETLLGQNFDGEEFFGQHIQRLELSGKGVSTVSLDMTLPRQFPVIGSVIADLTGDGSLENAFIRNRNLYVFNGAKRIYKSVKKMGGSISFLTYDTDPSFKQDPKTTTAAFEISPLAVDLDGDGRNELVAVASERSVIGSLGIAPGLNKTWIDVLKYADGRFSSGKLGEEFELALQGITLNQNRLLLVATEPGEMLDQHRAASYLLKYGLAP